MPDQLSFFTEQPAPLKNYPGRKGAAGAWQQILSNIPKCELFIECMAGSGLISSLVKGCQLIVNDIDKTVIDKIAYAADNVNFLHLHYKAILKRFNNGSAGRVFYFDPPYLMETRSYQGKLYRHEWKKSDHLEFLKIVSKITSPVLISHFPCQLYDTRLKNWRKITYNTMTRAGARMENLYMNFSQPVLLQTYQHTGKNFTDRQRIKRKVERLIERLKNEPANERAAILSSVIDHFNYVISK